MTVANGGNSPQTAAGQLDLASILTAAGSLFAFIGGVSLTGTIGRIVRNDPVPLTVAVVLVLLGTALLVAAGLKSTSKFLGVVFSIVGLNLTLGSFIIVGALAIRSGHHRERPSISAALDETGRNVKGTVNVATLDSSSRVVAVVQGVTENAAGDVQDAHVIGRSDVGPNDEGKVDLDLTTRLPAGRYDAVRIAAWTVDADKAQAAKASQGSDLACQVKDEPKPEDTATTAGKGCVRLPIAPVSVGPSLQAQWVDTMTSQIAVEVSASNAAAPLSGAEGAGSRVAVVVKRRKTGQRYYRFYRAILTPDADGTFKSKFKVPVAPGVRRICIAAMYLANDESPSVRCRGSLKDFKPKQAVVQLTRPKPPAQGTG